MGNIAQYVCLALFVGTVICLIGAAIEGVEVARLLKLRRSRWVEVSPGHFVNQSTGPDELKGDFTIVQKNKTTMAIREQSSGDRASRTANRQKVQGNA